VRLIQCLTGKGQELLRYADHTEMMISVPSQPQDPSYTACQTDNYRLVRSLDYNVLGDHEYLLVNRTCTNCNDGVQHINLAFFPTLTLYSHHFHIIKSSSSHPSSIASAR
jgi:hypothetical protein